MEGHKPKRKALILCNPKLPLDFHDFKVDADAVLILPYDGNRGSGRFALKGYSVYYG